MRAARAVCLLTRFARSRLEYHAPTVAQRPGDEPSATTRGHYLALLERKPNSFDFGKPFEDWKLPKGMRVLQRRLESESGKEGRREFIKILRLLEKYSFDELGSAVERALQINATTVDVIRILLQENREQPAKLFMLDDRPHLQDHSIPEPHLFKYNQLLSSEGKHHEEA